MNEIGQNIRKKRFANGSISFEREKKRFALDEASYPISYKADKRKESNFMVEEYMLLANQKVGKFIVDTCQEIGLLRCHPPPGNVKVNAFEMLLDKLNLKMKFTSSKDIQESSAAIFNDPTVPDSYKAVVRYRMCKVLEAAKYFVVEKIPASEWKHFALSFDIYTHFTSPIRFDSLSFFPLILLKDVILMCWFIVCLKNASSINKMSNNMLTSIICWQLWTNVMNANSIPREFLMHVKKYYQISFFQKITFPILAVYVSLHEEKSSFYTSNCCRLLLSINRNLHTSHRNRKGFFETYFLQYSYPFVENFLERFQDIQIM